MAEMRSRPGAQLSAQLVFGCVVIALGVIFTLDNLGALQAGPVLRWWPIVLVLFGLTRMTGSGASHRRIAGAVIGGIGLLMLLSSLDLIRFSIWDLWPLAMVAGGASLVLRGMRRGGPRGPDGTVATDSDDRLQAFVIMGGVVRKLNSGHFFGGEATALMGGIHLDLRGAQPAGDTVMLDVLVWWGGIELKVPTDWKVVSEVAPIMAGIEDKTKLQADGRTRLILRGLVVMGGIEIGN